MSDESKPLPLPDYDQLPANSIEHRIRPLDRAAVEQLLEHERGHAARPQVIQFLTARLDELAAGAQPSSGDPGAEQPERPDAGAHGSPANPDSAAEPTEPLRHGKHRMP